MKLVRLAGLCLVGLLLSQHVAYAQSAPAAGVLIGFNESYFATSPKNNTDPKPGMMVGAFGILRKDKGFKIQPEISFTQRRVDVTYGSGTTGYSTNYLNLGVMTRLKLFKGLYTSQGGQFSFPLRAKLDLVGTKVDVKDNIQWDFSIPVGVGKQFSKRFGFEGRWDSGLKRVEEAPLGNFVKRNRAIEFMALVGF